VIVTGSNIPTAEEVGPHPVDTYRRDDITRLGVRTSTDLVEKLPAATGSVLNENGANGPDGRVEINLRGILAKETLVLQDGRRLAPVGFAGDTVDLNTFPLGLIDHVDVLKDGASAIYGADAVSGVFNVWLIHRFRGMELYASYGNTNLGFANDAGEERTYLLAGTGDDKTDVVVYAELYNRAGIASRDVDISHDSDFTPFGGPDARSGNFAGRVGGRFYVRSLNGGARTPTPHAFPNASHDPEYVPLGSLPIEQRGFNFTDFTPEVAPIDREYLYGSVTREICDKFLSVFADFKYTRSYWDSGLAEAPFSPDIFTDANHPFGLSSSGFSVPIQNPFNPFTVPDYVSVGGFDRKVPESEASAAPAGVGFTTGVRYRALEVGLRTQKISTDNYEFTGGFKGALGELGSYFKDWEWETGLRYNEDSRLNRFGGIVNTYALREALLDTNPATAFNPFGLNQNTKAALNRVFVSTNRIGITSLELADGKLSGTMFSLPAGPVTFAIGGEYRKEHASDQPDALTAAAQTIGASNFDPTKGSRDVWSTYWEVRLPVTSSTWKWPGFYSLELDYQERFEDFSDFGGTERPKFALRWQPIDSSLTLRASYSEAYHAPTLRDLFGGPQQAFPQIFDQRSPATEPQVDARFGGNPLLQPETAYEWGYGAVLTPAKWWSGLEGLTVLADFYHVDLRAVTVSLDPEFLVQHESEFPSQVIRGPSTGPDDPFGPIILLLLPEQNLGRLVQEGWDFGAVYTFDTSRLGHGDFGTLTLTGNGTYLERVVLQATPGGPEQNVIGKFGGGFLGAGGGGSFTHNRDYVSIFYDGAANSFLAGLDSGFTVHFVGQYWDVRGFELLTPTPGAPGNPNHGIPPGFTEQNRKVREWITLDFILNYTFHAPTAPSPNEVPGLTKNRPVSSGKDDKGKATDQVSTAEFNPCGWRAWLDNTTITVGMNNVFDEQPPFVAAAFEEGYDESTANAKGRTWYVSLKKRF
jgi:iron complex outermembrane receptor protein